LSRHYPVHVTLRVRDDVENLRTKSLGRIVFAAFAKARARFGLRLVHFCIEHNHLHLLVEAENNSSLSRGMQGLAIRLARRINTRLHRRGSFFADRYHARILTTPLEVRRCILYVLNNYRRHLAQLRARAPRDWADPFSSIDYFDGLRPLPNGKKPVAEFCLGRDPPVAPPDTWLLRRGWRRHGLISLTEIPGGVG
jgi:REP element-mobilizing transposase RayT